MKNIIIKYTTAIFLLIVSITTIYAQNLNITGKVTDSKSKEPIIGAMVLQKNTAYAVATDVNGVYTIKAPKGSTLEFHYKGYVTQKAVVKTDTINVQMMPDTTTLNDMVVTAHGVLRKASVVGAQATVVGRVGSFSYDNTKAEEYRQIEENRFNRVKDKPLSTFSIDVDAASYSNLRRKINHGEIPQADAIRTEELVNYFRYDYAKPEGNEVVKITTDAGTCPWNSKHRLVRIGLKSKEIPTENLPKSNFVFLIDVSGSMYGATRLDLVKASLKLLVNNLRQEDRVAIVVYAGAAGVVLPSTPGSDKQKIIEALSNLTAGGSTAGGRGIMLAYLTAKKNFIEGGNNRVILCTDGDFNVGVSSDTQLEELISKEKESGVYLTVLGYGMGNYKDNHMQTLAEKGNGNHAYIDNLQQANKVLVNEFGSNMFVAAKDVKLQVEFNPAKVEAYRLIGYESRLLKDEDFNNDSKDAGDMGPGHAVTALYEVVPVGAKSDYAGAVDELRYQKNSSKNKATKVAASDEMLYVKIRYKQPGNEKSVKLEVAFTDKENNNTSSDFRFASAVAMFGQLIRGSEFVKGKATYDDVIKLAKTGLDNDPQGYRAEFVRLVEAAKGL